MLHETYDTNTAELWREPERRRRLVRLCAQISGDRNAAEDLAQETLLEAWRNAHKLHDPSGVDRWLAAIARNVCLRWGRRRGRDDALEPLKPDDATADTTDVDVELERAELVELLDRALALLPPQTREVLVQRYVHDSPHAEIAARLGVSEDAVSMRLSRGKLSLRKVLASELRDDAVGHGLLDRDGAEWQETRVWCSECGRRKLVMRRERAPGAVSFRCPDCQPTPADLASDFRLDNPVFARLVGEVSRPASILRRVSEWSEQYFAAERDRAVCTWCGRPMALLPHVRDDVQFDRSHRHGLVGRCDGCGEETWSSISGIALARPEVRSFRRDHARVRVVPVREGNWRGVEALLLRYEDVLGGNGVDVAFARESLRVLGVHSTTY